MAPQFYIPEIDINATQVIISSDEAKHIIKSYRAKVGDTIKLFNGKGYLFQGVILGIKKCNKEIIISIKILETKFVNRNKNKIFLYQSVIKLEKFELVLEKVTELGVDCIIPVITERCEVDINKFLSKYNRFNKILVESTKQAERSYIPEILNSKKIEQCFVEDKNYKSFNIVAYKNKISSPVFEVLNFIKEQKTDTNYKLNLFVGPEGDFTEQEIKYFVKQENTFFVHLGGNVLRSETAGILLVGLISQYFI